MGLFYNYEKPGPGIDKNAPKKKGLALFFSVFFRKFFPLIKANILYFLVSLPFLAVLFFWIAPQFVDLFFDGNMEGVDPSLHNMFNMVFCGLLFNSFGSGPAAASYSYVVRSFLREEPIWLVSDGFDKFKENFKQSMALVVIDCVILFVVGVALRYYFTRGSALAVMIFAVLMIAYLIYAMAHRFMYQIMVTYECKLIDVIRNGLIMTMAKLPICLLLMVITGAICIAIFGLLGLVAVVIYATVGMSLTRFPLELYAAEVIEKNIEKTKAN